MVAVGTLREKISVKRRKDIACFGGLMSLLVIRGTCDLVDHRDLNNTKADDERRVRHPIGS